MHDVIEKTGDLDDEFNSFFCILSTFLCCPCTNLVKDSRHTWSLILAETTILAERNCQCVQLGSKKLPMIGLDEIAFFGWGGGGGGGFPPL